MNVLHVLTTGSSLLGNLANGAEDQYRQVVGALLPGNDGPGTVRELLCAACTDTALDTARLLTFDQLAEIDAAPVWDAAEWTSVDAVQRDQRFFPQSADRYREAFVFLASDTDQGLRAAVLLAARYSPGALRYVPEPRALDGRLVRPGEAWACRIPDLDLGTKEPTGHTWRSLGATGRLVADTVGQYPGGWTVFLHYTGGYKAVVPYAVVLAEAIRSRLVYDDARVPVRAVALHKDSPDDDETPVIVEVPVRAMGSDLWADVVRLRKALSGDRDVVPAGTADRLGGLLLEPVDQHTMRVTAPGLITTHVL